MQDNDKTVKPFRRAFEPYFTYREQAILRQWIERYWITFLSPAEYKTLGVIISRTISWGKLWETIPLRHFTEGAALKPRAQAGDSLLTARAFRGTGMSANTVRTAIRSLSAHGFICSKPHRDTTRYAINWNDMGSERDPVLQRFDIGVEAQELQAELAAIHRRNRAEGGSTFEPLSNIQHHSFHSFPSSTVVEDYSAPGALESSSTAPQGTEQMPFPPRRVPKAKPTPDDESEAISGAADWRSRPARVSNRTAYDESSKDVIHAAKALVPAAPQVLLGGDYIQKTMQDSARARHDKAMKGKENGEKVYTCWAAGYAVATGLPTPPLKGKWSGQVKNIVASSTLPDPRMRWGVVAEWVAECYGEAVMLAVPFMLRTEEKRASILHVAPSFTLFLAFPEHFANAFAIRTYGEGHPAEVRGMAEAAQREHERWMQRRGQAVERTHEGISGNLRTVDELMDLAVQEAETDPQVARLMAERAALQAIHRATKGEGPAREARADEAVRRERTRTRVAEAAPDRERLAKEMGVRIYSENPDDYYNEE